MRRRRTTSAAATVPIAPGARATPAPPNSSIETVSVPVEPGTKVASPEERLGMATWAPQRPPPAQYAWSAPRPQSTVAATMPAQRAIILALLVYTQLLPGFVRSLARGYQRLHVATAAIAHLIGQIFRQFTFRDVGSLLALVLGKFI